MRDYTPAAPPARGRIAPLRTSPAARGRVSLARPCKLAAFRQMQGVSFAPASVRIITFNVNGIRSSERRGLRALARPRRSPGTSCACRRSRRRTTTFRRSLKAPRSSHAAFLPAERKGYSGVAIYAKRPPRIVAGFGCAEFDAEGRYLEAHFAELTVVNVYLPSGSSGPHRQASKFRFLDAFLPHLAKLRKRKREIVLCGDWNIAHREIDLKNWRANRKNSGFLPEEREWLTRVFDELGFVDVFRRIDPRPDRYTWWSNRGQAWAKNVGWRIDYQIATPGIAAKANGGVDLHQPALLRSCATRDRLRLRAQVMPSQRHARRRARVERSRDAAPDRPRPRPRRQAPARRRESDRPSRTQGRSRRPERLRQVEPLRADPRGARTRMPEASSCRRRGRSHTSRRRHPPSRPPPSSSCRTAIASCARSSGSWRRPRPPPSAIPNGQGEALALLHHRFEDIGGYSARARAATLLSGLGFPGRVPRGLRRERFPAAGACGSISRRR